MQFDFAPAAPSGYTPYPFQWDAIKAIQAAHARQVRSMLIVMPTGTGKGFVGSQLPKALNGFPALWLAQRQELLDQACTDLRNSNPKLTVEVEQGDRYAEHDADVVVASVPTLGRKDSRRKEKFRRFGLVICDESHHSPSETHLNVMRYFGAGREGGPPLVGMTATPIRSDKQKLENIFDEVVYELTLLDAIKRGYLCRIRAKRVQTDVDLSQVKAARGGDFIESELATVTNTDYRNSLLCSAIEQHGVGRRTILVFCVDVAHAQVTAQHLVDRGHKAECVVGTTRDRDRILRRFREGETRIVTSCGVLTEGYNNPPIDCIAMGRPTKSRLLFCQMAGRGTRLSPATGKHDLLIIDVVDVCGKHRIETTSTLFGLREMDLLGEDVLDAATICEVAEQRGLQVEDGDRIDNVAARSEQLTLLSKKTISVGTRAEDVDVFAACKVSKTVERESEFPWIRLPNDTYVLPIDGPKRAILRRDKFGIWNCDVKGGDVHETRTRLGSTQSDETGGGASDTTRIGGMNCGKGDTPPFREADKVVKRFAGYRLCDDRPPMPWWKILRQGAKWRRLPATDGQRAALRRWGVRVPDMLMRGVASTMLETLRLRREQV